MKGTKILTLLSIAAGAAVVGATFAAHAVNDEAEPFGVKVSPGSFSTDGTPLVTLKYGSAPIKANVGDLESGKPRMAAEVSLVADTSDGEAYTGAFTMTLIDQTVGKGENEAKLIDNLEVDLYDVEIDYEAIGGEIAASELAGKSAIAHIPPSPGTYTASKTISVSDNQAKTVYVVVSLGTNDAKDLLEIANDVVYLQMDWGKGSAQDVEATPIYFEYTPQTGEKAYAFAWKDSKVNAAFPGEEMTYEGNGLYSYLLSTGFENVVFSVRNSSNEEVWKSADQEITSTIRTQSPSFNKAAGTWGTKPDASLTAAYYLKGTFNGWAASADWALTVDAQDANHYSISGVNLNAGDKLKVWARQGETQWYSSGEWTDCGFTIDSEGNVVVSAQGVYTVDFYVVDQYNEGHHIVLTKAAA